MKEVLTILAYIPVAVSIVALFLSIGFLAYEMKTYHFPKRDKTSTQGELDE